MILDLVWINTLSALINSFCFFKIATDCLLVHRIIGNCKRNIVDNTNKLLFQAMCLCIFGWWNKPQAVFKRIYFTNKIFGQVRQTVHFVFQIAHCCFHFINTVTVKCFLLIHFLNFFPRMKWSYKAQNQKEKQNEELVKQLKIQQVILSALKPRLHKTDMGGCFHFSTTMFHEGKAECFACGAVVNHERKVIGVMKR